MEIAPGDLSRLFGELSEWLEYAGCDPVEWVVCGGVALALQGLQARGTRDMDVLGSWHEGSKQIAGIAEFSEEIKGCIERVASEHSELGGLGVNWVNLGPSKLVEFGLPAGFERRLTSVTFGPRLTLHLLGREDLIALKLYAAADDFGARQEVHLEDLRGLAPTYGELEVAVDWTRALPDFEMKRSEIKDTIASLGYDDLAYYI